MFLIVQAFLTKQIYSILSKIGKVLVAYSTAINLNILEIVMKILNRLNILFCS